MWNRRWLFWTEVYAPEEKYRGPKQSPTNLHNDQKIDGAKLLLSLIIAILDILMHFRCNLWRNTLTYFCTHCLSIPVREFRSVQAWWSSRKFINAHVRGAVRALGSCFKRKCTWRSWHHDLESIRHDLESLCSDNDPRCHMRNIKIIASDWIVLLRRLLIPYKIWSLLYHIWIYYLCWK